MTLAEYRTRQIVALERIAAALEASNRRFRPLPVSTEDFSAVFYTSDELIALREAEEEARRARGNAPTLDGAQPPGPVDSQGKEWGSSV